MQAAGFLLSAALGRCGTAAVAGGANQRWHGLVVAVFGVDHGDPAVEQGYGPVAVGAPIEPTLTMSVEIARC